MADKISRVRIIERVSRPEDVAWNRGTGARVDPVVQGRVPVRRAPRTDGLASSCGGRRPVGVEEDVGRSHRGHGGEEGGRGHEAGAGNKLTLTTKFHGSKILELKGGSRERGVTGA